MADSAGLTTNGTARVPLFGEIGVTGLNYWGGRLDEEIVRELRDPRRRFLQFREMADNDAIVGASLNTFELLSRSVTWDFAPAVDDLESQHDAQFARECLFEDMSQPWESLVAEVMRCLPLYGWTFHELCYKRRTGATASPGESSRFTDGGIGWRKMPIRAQETLERWNFDESGGTHSFVQRPPSGSGLLHIPIEKAVLFRTSHHKGSPEGRSLLRNAWRAWRFKKRIEELQGIGIERDLAGLPMALIPGRMMSAEATGAERAMYQNVQEVLTAIRRDDQACIIFPSDRDEQGNLAYEFKLVSTGGQRQVETRPVLEYYDKAIAIALISDLILLGHERVGSLALMDKKSALLSAALGTFLDEIAIVLSRHALPRLWRLNGKPQETMPKLVHGDVETVDIETFANGLLRLAQAGFDFSDIENDVRRMVGLPLRIEEEVAA